MNVNIFKFAIFAQALILLSTSSMASKGSRDGDDDSNPSAKKKALVAIASDEELPDFFQFAGVVVKHEPESLLNAQVPAWPMYTRDLIRARLGEINPPVSVAGSAKKKRPEDNCLPCAIAFLKWMDNNVLQPASPKKPENSNILVNHESAELIDFEQADSIPAVPHVIVIGEDEFPYIDLDAPKKIVFVKDKADQLKDTFERMPLVDAKGGKCLAGMIFLKYTDSFLEKNNQASDRHKVVVEQEFEGHFLNFYIYQEDGKERVCLIIDSQTKEIRSLDKFIKDDIAKDGKKDLTYEDEIYLWWNKDKVFKNKRSSVAVKSEQMPDSGLESSHAEGSSKSDKSNNPSFVERMSSAAPFGGTTASPPQLFPGVRNLGSFLPFEVQFDLAVDDEEVPLDFDHNLASGLGDEPRDNRSYVPPVIVPFDLQQDTLDGQNPLPQEYDWRSKKFKVNNTLANPELFEEEDEQESSVSKSKFSATHPKRALFEGEEGQSNSSSNSSSSSAPYKKRNWRPAGKSIAAPTAGMAPVRSSRSSRDIELWNDEGVDEDFYGEDEGHTLYPKATSVRSSSVRKKNQQKTPSSAVVEKKRTPSSSRKKTTTPSTARKKKSKSSSEDSLANFPVVPLASIKAKDSFPLFKEQWVLDKLRELGFSGTELDHQIKKMQEAQVKILGDYLDDKDACVFAQVSDSCDFTVDKWHLHIDPESFWGVEGTFDERRQKRFQMTIDLLFTHQEIRSLNLSAYPYAPRELCDGLVKWNTKLRRLNLGFEAPVRVLKRQSQSSEESLPQNEDYFWTDREIQRLAENLPELEAIDLTNRAQITDVSIKHLLTHCKNLRRINLSGCSGITPAGIAYIADLGKNLTHLELAYCNVSNEQIDLLVSGCPNLECLNLEGIWISGGHLRNIANLQKLTHLNVVGNKKVNYIGDIDQKENYFSSSDLDSLIEDCESLATLSISGGVNKISLTKIKDLSVGKKLKEIVIKNMLSDKTRHYLKLLFPSEEQNEVVLATKAFPKPANIPGMGNRKVSKYNFDSTDVDTAQAAFPDLGTLDLSHSPVSVADLQDFVRGFTALRSLSLTRMYSYAVEIDELKFVLLFDKLSNLESLSLSTDQISLATVVRILQKSYKVKELTLKSVNITDNIGELNTTLIMEILKSPRLTQLTIWSTHQETIDALLKLKDQEEFKVLGKELVVKFRGE